MPWCPFAERVDVPLRDSQKRPIVPQGLVLHTAVSNASLLKPTGTTRWTFYLNREGKLYQFFSTTTPAACQLDGNYWTVNGEGRGFLSVETWDGAGSPIWMNPNNIEACPPWNDAQLDTLVRLCVWLHKTHDIPLELPTNPRGRGIGYHSQFRGGKGLKWTRDHACPTPNRIAQVDDILARARRMAKGEDEVTPKQMEELIDRLLDREVSITPNAMKLVTGEAKAEKRSVKQLLSWAYARATAAHLAVSDTKKLANAIVAHLPAGSVDVAVLERAVEAGVRDVLGSLDEEG